MNLDRRASRRRRHRVTEHINVGARDIERPATTPPHLYGRWRRDPAIRLASMLVRTTMFTSVHLGRPRLPVEQNPARPLRLISREAVAVDENVVAFTFASADSEPLDPWHPGAHIDVQLASGRIRQYSLCGDPGNPDSYRIAVRRIPGGGGGSIELHDTLRVGSTITTMGPRNAFSMPAPGYGSPAQRIRFVAGGIGITPILPMLLAAERLGIEWSMIYCGRSRASIPFLDELVQFGDKVTIHTDDDDGIPTADTLLSSLDPDQDNAGHPAKSITAVYACGPGPMIAAVRSGLIDRRDIELHFERFAPPTVENGHPFRVRLARSGTELDVAADQTLLAALRANDPNTRYSCQQGFCGTCRVKVLAGEVDHREVLLTDPEHADGVMLSCVSRAAEPGGTLELDA